MNKKSDVVIVGAGHAGAACASALRKLNFPGSILVIGAEPELPYERPPLSKAYLADTKRFEDLLIHPGSLWQERNIEFMLDTVVNTVDSEQHCVITDAGEIVHYSTLVWATGGAPRQLRCQGSDLQGVHSIRTRADADRIKADMAHVEHAVIIGGGYIGLEAAAALATLGKQVTLIEALDRVLARVAGADLAHFYESEHRAHGVDIRLSSAVESIEGHDRVTGVLLTSGEVIKADMVIVGIGIIPATHALTAAGAAGENGVLVDLHCRTSLPDVLAIGDCALHPNLFAEGQLLRIESVQNANDQAAVAAKTICGDLVEYRKIPWFWSDQYDLKLQTVGLSAGFDDTVVRGDPSLRSFSVIYLRNGKVIALDCVNAMKDYVQGKRLVMEGASVAPEVLSDTSIYLKDIPH
ncbi:NAD(P)/FAD-dependent oxidoreductase [Pseudomonas fluorescens]|uniref:Ferredoxin--NAD(P)(+) reductase fdr n=1 Tax=Pseudomonas fluorescens TaxID=294 RepID=A0A5E7CV90_PSEFL|nr:FAD-dependent oxidoreductase [Pseudomonas fluorescens]VVO03655.1 Ferredoxin--NAD(P)(+) reductase fdr [Pseudomonas fluorescens]